MCMKHWPRVPGLAVTYKLDSHNDEIACHSTLGILTKIRRSKVLLRADSSFFDIVPGDRLICLCLMCCYCCHCCALGHVPLTQMWLECDKSSCPLAYGGGGLRAVAKRQEDYK